MRNLLLVAALASCFVAACKGERTAWTEAMKASHQQGKWRSHPIFTVRDMKAAKAYYRDRLGFRVDWEHDYETFGIFVREGTVVFACENCQGQPGAWAMLFVSDIDDLYDEFKQRRAAVVEPPEDRPWGLREMLVRDPDGNTLRVAENRPH